MWYMVHLLMGLSCSIMKHICTYYTVERENSAPNNMDLAYDGIWQKKLEISLYECAYVFGRPQHTAFNSLYTEQLLYVILVKR